MAIPETEPVKNHYGNNSATSFDFDFYIEKSSQLKVQHTDLNGALTTLKENVDYSIHEIGNENGSYITFPISGSTYDILKWDTVNDKKELLTISLNIPLKQEFEFDISGDLDKHQLEKAFDYQMRVDQILNRKINRAVLVPEGSELTPTELIETLQNSKAEAVQAASDAAMSATNAQNSANLSKEQSDIASDKLNAINQKMEEFSDNYNFATNDIQNKHSDAILDIQNNLQMAEDTIIADRTEAIQAITKNKNNAISDITTAGAEQVTNIKQTGFYMQDDKLYYIDSNGETKEFKSGGGGLELCDIGTALYIDETKGLRRRLNGQIVDINTNTQGFLTRLKQITTLYPSLLCTEEEWQAIKSASKLGQCGKFVFNYSGAEIVSVRIPSVVNINGLADMANAGLIKDESLPNIAGTVGNIAFVNRVMNFTGCFYQNVYHGYTGAGTQYQGQTSGIVEVGTDASLSSSTYQDNAHVQQEAIQYPYFIQIATGQETENNIVNDIELNNPYSLFDHKYSDHELNNLSWLKSEAQWNAKTVYTDAYDKLFKVYNGTEIVEGLSVKLSTETYTDYDFVLNTSDETFRLPLKTKLASGKAIVGNGKTLILTTGEFDTDLHQGSTRGNVYLGEGIFEVLPSTNSGLISSSAPAGAKLGLTTDPTKSGIELSDSGLYLYFYVGETVQNANLIDAGRINEQLSGLVEVGGSLGMPSNKYVNLTLGASGDSYTAPANGWLHLRVNKSVAGFSAFYSSSGLSAESRTTVSGANCTVYIPCKKGDVVTCYYDGTNVDIVFTFIYAVGDV